MVDDSLLSCAKDAEVHIVVDRGGQRAYLLVDGQVAIDTPVSTGASGHTTPLGDFTILEKRRSGKISTIYKCPLPRWMRLTWRGIGMHVGKLPGYPASHGCIRLPEEGASAIFAHAPAGTKVTVVKEWTGPSGDTSLAAQ
ncbi:MAG: L,D-transpeptidase [Akkermansiaceae bacterium]|nr:L,D-transpeptidase [Akkermansiaceae bacterium]